MRHASIRALYAHWLTLSAGRPAPARTEINPQAIAGQLGDLFILDGDLESFAFRLAGSRMTHALGRDVTGSAFLSVFQATVLQNAHAMLECAAREIVPSLIGVRDPSRSVLEPKPAAPSPFDQLTRAFGTADPASGGFARPLERRRSGGGNGEMVLLPLSHRGRLGARLIGALAVFEPPVEPPPVPVELSITGTRILGRDSNPRQPLGLVAQATAGAVSTRRGHLVVLRGGLAE